MIDIPLNTLVLQTISRYEDYFPVELTPDVTPVALVSVKSDARRITARDRLATPQPLNRNVPP
jgi:hypothetical protein